MKTTTATFVAILLLALAASPALADSIPIPPITSVNFSGVNTTGSFFSSSTDYDIGGANWSNTNFCSLNCIEFSVKNGVPTGGDLTNFAEIGSFTNASGASGELFGSLGRVRFNPQTDVLSTVFWGKEQMVVFVSGKWWPIYWYSVQGTFTENLATGVGSVNLTKETFIGTADTPEPGTFLTLGTGLFAMAGVVRRRKLGSR